MSEQTETEQEQFTRVIKKMPAILRKLGDALTLTADALEDLVVAFDDFDEAAALEESNS